MIRNGIDLIEVARIEKSIEQPHFLERVFGPQERAAWAQSPQAAVHAAGAFAAKEAFSKALGTGIRGFDLCEVQVLHDALGAPYFALSGRALQCAEQQKLSFSLSITHTNELAAAFVVAETKGD